MFYLDDVAYNRKELIMYLIKKGQIKKYSQTRKFFRKEVSKKELPELYTTKSGYYYAVIEL